MQNYVYGVLKMGSLHLTVHVKSISITQAYGYGVSQIISHHSVARVVHSITRIRSVIGVAETPVHGATQALSLRLILIAMI